MCGLRKKTGVTFGVAMSMRWMRRRAAVQPNPMTETVSMNPLLVIEAEILKDGRLQVLARVLLKFH
jgi:hypothetical protein